MTRKAPNQDRLANRLRVTRRGRTSGHTRSSIIAARVTSLVCVKRLEECGFSGNVSVIDFPAAAGRSTQAQTRKDINKRGKGEASYTIVMPQHCSLDRLT